jgi:lipopolysaccharide transport system permease protein
MTDQHESVVDADKTRLLAWGELWRYRELFYFFTWRDIKVKYKQTFLGILWAILQPLVMMVIFTYFFANALHVPAQKLPYPVFVFSGLLIWNTFASGLTNSANSMVSNALIIKKIYFPRLVIPVSAILVSLFDFCMAFGLFIILLLYFQQPVSWNAIWSWPLAVSIGALATIGPGSFLAALTVKYRDFRYVIPFLVQLLFFISPVIYPVSMLKYPFLKYIVVASPLYAAIELFRFPLVGFNLDLEMIALSLSSCLLFLVLGLLYFRKTEDFFADFA